MESYPIHAEQFAAEREINAATARRLVMIRSFYAAGRTREYIAKAMRLKPETIRHYEKKFINDAASAHEPGN